MKSELGAWNNGKGIDLSSWVSCTGNFSLAVGYMSVFWPEFVEFEGYILRKGFSEKSLRSWEAQKGATRKSTEYVMNHIHIDALHHSACEDISRDKLVLLGNGLREIYEAKLKWLFPNSPCKVELLLPEDEDVLDEYQLSFWQLKHE
jgi:hypothetical protein